MKQNRDRGDCHLISQHRCLLHCKACCAQPAYRFSLRRDYTGPMCWQKCLQVSSSRFFVVLLVCMCTAFSLSVLDIDYVQQNLTACSLVVMSRVAMGTKLHFIIQQPQPLQTHIMAVHSPSPRQWKERRLPSILSRLHLSPKNYLPSSPSLPRLTIRSWRMHGSLKGRLLLK